MLSYVYGSTIDNKGNYKRVLSSTMGSIGYIDYIEYTSGSKYMYIHRRSQNSIYTDYKSYTYSVTESSISFADICADASYVYILANSVLVILNSDYTLFKTIKLTYTLTHIELYPANGYVFGWNAQNLCIINISTGAITRPINTTGIFDNVKIVNRTRLLYIHIKSSTNYWLMYRCNTSGQIYNSVTVGDYDIIEPINLEFYDAYGSTSIGHYLLNFDTVIALNIQAFGSTVKKINRVKLCNDGNILALINNDGEIKFCTKNNYGSWNVVSSFGEQNTNLKYSINSRFLEYNGILTFMSEVDNVIWNLNLKNYYSSYALY